MYKSKKAVSIILIMVMLFICNTTTFAAQTNPMIDSQITSYTLNDKIYYETEIDPYNIQQVEQIISSYDLMPETAAAIREFASKCITGEIEEGELSLSTPYNPFLKASAAYRDYVGYEKRNYREELITLSSTSQSAVVYQGSKTWLQYATDFIADILSYAAEGYLNTYSCGTYEIGKIIIGSVPSGVPTNTAFRHEARCIETKTKKYTYVQEAGSYYLGSRVETCTHYFSNEAIWPGYTPKLTGTTPSKSWTSPGYNKPDQLAYFGYPMGGVIENCESYKYGGVTFYSIS